ncbi:Papain-like cysteine protease AvrRpt2 [Zobellia uliginosa]|uniref:Papain-like cysteine protease AvrRpt2 n=1 Tax=Zobellia uliginosa TaxID=143224 RepID=A0ABY1KSZ7_9FLAO|nr:C39 family peptidase [Zobellia uliginosa]SIS71677.1 Papain-like cysteine protease AvrRpt2 [Zobellia uliginosa]
MEKNVFKLIGGVLLMVMYQSCCTPSATIGSVNNTLRPQETRNWCWAAVTQMIAQNEGKIVSQCDLANHRFSMTNCCDFENTGESCPKTNDCNRPGWLELTFAGVKYSEDTTALSWDKLKKSIYCNKDVLGYAYGTPGVVGHVVAVRGYVSIAGTNYVVLNDPWSPCNGTERMITYEEYVNPSGTATHWRTWYGISKI